MKLSRDWPPIERLPEAPGVVKMTGTGYVIDGKHVRTVHRNSEAPSPHKGWLYRVMGK